MYILILVTLVNMATPASQGVLELRNAFNSKETCQAAGNALVAFVGAKSAFICAFKG